MKGVIAAGTPYTAEAGAEMLRRGGNAVDAAVAAAFASFITEAASSAIGGGGFATVIGPDRDPAVYDFFCATPSQRTIAPEDVDFTEVPIPFGDMTDSYWVGRASTAVPGNPAGLAMLLEEAGSLPLADVLQPAIRLAREGVILSPEQASLVRSLGNVLCYSPGSAALFTQDGRLMGEGDHFSKPALADTLAVIAEQGWQSFYTGTLAEAIIADQQAHGGWLTADDLRNYQVIKRPPLKLDYKGYTLYTNPPPSTGGILIAYALGLLSNADLSALNYQDADHLALLCEIMRQADKARFRDEPNTLVEPSQWAEWLQPERVQEDWQQVAQCLRDGPPQQAIDSPPAPRGTTHISAIDESGLSVSLTTTPGATGGYVVGDTGMILNNMLGEADLNPAGFHKWKAGVRVTSMTSPTVVDNPDGHRLVLGSAGSNRIRSAVLQVISNVLDWKLPLDEAVNGPRVHFKDDVFDLELGYQPDAADALEAKGYEVLRWTTKNVYFGGVNMALRWRDGRFEGVGDSRRGGSYILVT